MLYKLRLILSILLFNAQYKFVLKSCGRGSYVLLSNILNPSYIEFGRNVKIKFNARIECITQYAGNKYHPSLVFGNDISVEQNFHITCVNKIVVGRGCMISYNVGIQDSDHSVDSIDVDFKMQKLKVKSVIIGDNCFIGAGAVILAGTELGANCVVGANSVVRGIFPSNSVIAGNPGVIIKKV